MYKKVWRLIQFLAIFITVLVFPIKASAVEQIRDYNVEILINPDSSINVTETIAYDFDGELRHGIYRKIPFTVTNDKGQKFSLDMDVESVSYAENKRVPYTISTQGNEINIKIGDPDREITGLATYIIKYKVNGAFTYFADHDELYWDAVGTGWDVPILRSRASIYMSKLSGLDSENTKIVCYTGYEGSKSTNCSSKIVIPNAEVSSTESFGAREGLTFALWLPKGTVAFVEPTPYKLTDSLDKNIIIAIATAILSVFIGIVYWFINGRDPRDNRILVRMYDPPKGPDKKELTPIEVGTIIDENIHPRDISAEIINLAIKKYIVINEEQNKYLGGIIKTSKTILSQGPNLKEDYAMKGLKSHEIGIIEALGLHLQEIVSLDGNNESIAKSLLKVKDSLYKNLADEGYFYEDPTKLRGKFIIAGIILIFFGFFHPSLIFLLGPGFVMIVLSVVIPKKTVQGVEAVRHALGLKEFLVSQDRQFEFQEKNLYLFEKLLPYAISLGVAKVWASKFKDLSNYNPDWYSSNSMSNFNSIAFMNSLQTNLSSIESSSGFSSSGGSSGGGGGGGGGGSW